MRCLRTLAALAFVAPLLSVARAEPPPISRASCRAALGEAALIVEADLRLVLPARAETSVRLMSTAFALVGQPSGGPSARIITRGGAYWLRLRPAGDDGVSRPGRLKFSFRTPLAAHGGGFEGGMAVVKRVAARAGLRDGPASFLAEHPDARACALPVLPARRMTIDLPPQLHDLSVDPKAPVEHLDDRLRLYPTAARMLVLRWRTAPPPRRAAPVFRASTDTSARVTATRLSAATTLRLDVLQGELPRLALTLPAGALLRSVAGADLREWAVRGRTLTVELRQPVKGTTKLALRYELLADADGRFVWRPIVAPAAQHQGGSVYCRAAPGLLLRATTRPGLERISDGYAPDAAAGLQTLALVYARLPASLALAVTRQRPRVTADVAALARLERGVVTQTAQVHFAILDVGVRRLQLRVGPGADVLSVACPGLLAHEVDRGVLTVRLREATKGKLTLKVAVQVPLERVDGVVIPRLLALGVERQSGMVGVATGPNVELRHKRAVEADQVDVRLLPAWARTLEPKLAYRYYDRPNSLVAIETARLEPEFDVVASDTSTLGSDGWTRALTWRCKVGRGEVFACRLRVPENVVPLDVAATVPKEAGSALKDWEFDEASRVLKVALSRGLRGEFALAAQFAQRVPEATPAETLRAVTLEGSRRYSGQLTVQSRIPVALRPTALRGLEATRGREGQLAFTLDGPAWQVDLAATPIEPVIDVQALTLLAGRQGQIAADAVLHYSIRKAPVNALTVRLPEGAVNSSIAGSGIRSSQLDGRDWTVRLDHKLLGSYSLRVVYDHAVPAEGGSQACGTVETPGATRHEGYLVVTRGSDRIEMGLGQADGLTPIEPSAIPMDRQRLAGHPVIAAYGYTERATLSLEVRVLGRAEVLQAKALGAIVETVVRQDGQTLTELTYDIQNIGRQFLRVDLPDDATLLAAYVVGAPVSSATAPDGATLVPLLGKKGIERALEVSILYAEDNPPLDTDGTLRLASPPVDVRTESLSWAVYLPPGFRAVSTDGNMTLLAEPPHTGVQGGAIAMLSDEGRALAAAWAWVVRHTGIILTCLGIAAGAVAVALVAKRLVRWHEARLARQAATATARAARRSVFRLSRAAVWVIVIGLITVLLAGMLLPSLSRAREEARRIRARSNLNQIAKAMAIYLNEHGDNRFYPATMEQLKSVCPDEGVFIDPSSGNRFVYLFEGTYIRDDHPPNEPLGYSVGAGGVSIVFFDSHVEFLPFGDERLATLLPGHTFGEQGVSYAGMRLEEPTEEQKASGEWEYVPGEMGSASEGGGGGGGDYWVRRRKAPPGSTGRATRGTPPQEAARRLLDRYAREVAATEGEKRRRAAQHLRVGKDKFDRQSFGDAAASFEKALRLDPTNKEARDYLAKAGSMLALTDPSGDKTLAEYARQKTIAPEVHKTELSHLLDDAKKLYRQKNYAQAAEALARVGARAKYLSAYANVHGTAQEAERYLAWSLGKLAERKREQNELLAQLDEELEGKKADYGQRKLLDRIKRRQGRLQVGQSPLDDIVGELADRQVGADALGRAAATQPSPPKPGTGTAARPKPAPKPKAPPAFGPPAAQPAPRAGPRPTTPGRRPGPGEKRGPGGGEGGARADAGDTRTRGHPPPAPATQVATLRYAPVRGGLQKGALPIRLELPSDGSLPYFFHRPVTGIARGEIELVCRRHGSRSSARAVLWLGILAFVGLLVFRAGQSYKAAGRRARHVPEPQGDRS